MRIPGLRSLAAAALGLAALLAASCRPGGTYATSERVAGEADRGETNGRMFDLVSNMPDHDDWQIRIRDSSMWAAYASGTDEKQLGTVSLTAREARKVWTLIDDLDLGGRDAGSQDEDEGYVQLRLREPGGEEGHDTISVYLPRGTDDEAVTALARYLQELIRKYHRRSVDF